MAMFPTKKPSKAPFTKGKASERGSATPGGVFMNGTGGHTAKGVHTKPAGR